MRFPQSRWSLRVSAVALALSAVWGCGGKKETPVPVVPPSITQVDADDIAQQIGIMTSADNGGWFTMLESLNAMLPDILINTQAFTGGGTRTSATFLPRPSVLQDTTTSKGSMNYAWTIYYFHHAGTDSSGRPDTLTEFMGADVVGNGSLNAGGINATYGLFPDVAQGIQVFNLDASNDTLEFSAFFDDSSYGLVSSTINTGSQRVWYVQNTIEYELTLLKSQMPTTPYALKGEVSWVFIDAGIMAAPPSRTDVASSGQGMAHMTLTGTQDAIIEITDILNTSTIYRYHINLKTGAISRA